MSAAEQCRCAVLYVLGRHARHSKQAWSDCTACTSPDLCRIMPSANAKRGETPEFRGCQEISALHSGPRIAISHCLEDPTEQERLCQTRTSGSVWENLHFVRHPTEAVWASAMRSALRGGSFDVGLLVNLSLVEPIATERLLSRFVFPAKHGLPEKTIPGNIACAPGRWFGWLRSRAAPRGGPP